jgi:hypothetical protein
MRLRGCAAAGVRLKRPLPTFKGPGITEAQTRCDRTMFIYCSNKLTSRAGTSTHVIA